MAITEESGSECGEDREREGEREGKREAGLRRGGRSGEGKQRRGDGMKKTVTVWK